MTYEHSDARGPRGARSSRTSARARAARDLPRASTARSSPRACTATCRSARSASTSTSGPRTARTSASTGWSASTTRRSTRCARASTDKLEQVLAAILAGRPEDEVYALWRELTADDVAAAERRRREAARAGAAGDRARARSSRPCGRADRHAGAPRAASAVHCAVVLPQRRRGATLSVLVASLLEHALAAAAPVGPRRCRAPARSRSGSARASPSVTFTGRSAGWASLLTPTAPSPSSDRRAAAARRPAARTSTALVVLPMPAVATADVAELADLDLGGHALAAPLEPGTDGRQRLRRDPQRRAAARATAPSVAAELRRTAHARHRFDFDAFTDDVLVLDLARLRAERFGERGARARAGVRARRPRGPALPLRPRARRAAGALGGGADAHAAARARPPLLGRRRQALAARADGRARALARLPRRAEPPRRARTTPRPRRAAARSRSPRPSCSRSAAAAAGATPSAGSASSSGIFAATPKPSPARSTSSGSSTASPLSCTASSRSRAPRRGPRGPARAGRRAGRAPRAAGAAASARRRPSSIRVRSGSSSTAARMTCAQRSTNSAGP